MNGPARAISIFDRNISTFSIASPAQTLPERSQAENIVVIPRCTAKKPNHRHRRLLRARRERPRCRAAEQRKRAL
jgi:hypothetical protein